MDAGSHHVLDEDGPPRFDHAMRGGIERVLVLPASLLQAVFSAPWAA
jgi:hypothetical protein